MFVLDVQDFRKFSTCPIPVSEESAVAVLAEAGVTFDEKPMELRVRIKDLDHRRLVAKSEPVGDSGFAFRLTLYVYPETEALSERALSLFNRRVRHELKHMAQFRQAVATSPQEAAEYEKDAFVYEKQGTANFLA